MRLTFKVFIVAFTVVLGCCVLAFTQEQRTTTLNRNVAQRLALQADTLITAIKQLRAIPLNTRYSPRLQKRFRAVRLAYKKLEWAAEYFDPTTTRLFNGAPVPEAEVTGMLIGPEGLQVIEELIFPRYKSSAKKQLAALLSGLAQNAMQYKHYFTHANLQDWQIMDALKQEIFRVQILGLNDFDDPLARQCFAESAAALRSVSNVAAQYAGHDKALQMEFKQAINYLSKPVSFDRFDRAGFILKYANPLSRGLTKLSKSLNLPDIRYNRLLNKDAATLFDAGAFNRNAYIDAPQDSATEKKIALGKRLFFDPLLSGTGTRSCGSCHQPNKAFTDGLVKNVDLTGKRTIARNTPTLINAALQGAQFYDLRSLSLEQQAHDVMNNKDEMHGNMQVALPKLWKDAGYRSLFENAYPAKHRSAIDTAEVMNALASYVRSLTALNSRFDAYMQGNAKAITAAELNGFNLFMGKARCGTCHYMPLFNSTLPPRYMQMEFEVIGVPKTKAGKVIDADLGVYGILPFDFAKNAFKVTTVRNAARTAPYMHNGIYKTLQEVVDFYNKGGGAGLGLKIDNQTLSADKLNLTAKEQKELIAFINSLDSK